MTKSRVSRRAVLAATGVGFAVSLTGCTRFLPVDKGAETDNGGSMIYVGPNGTFRNPGTEDEPLGSIHRAANAADPGDTVVVQPGEYRETVEMEAGGDPDAPITITGSSEAILKPPAGKESPVFQIDSSYVYLTGLTITGLLNPDAPADPDSYHPDKLLSLNGDPSGPDDYVEGLVVSPNRLGNAGQSLINSKQLRNCDIGGFEVIGPAGTKWILDDTKGHNGEFVYLGVAAGNRLERGFEVYDRTRNIRVHHIDNSAGHPHSEMVDCKAGVENVTIEYCTDGGGVQSDESPYSRAISMDGKGCTMRYNLIQNAMGDGIRIGPQSFMSPDGKVLEPQTESDREMGTDHAIYGNVFTGNVHEAINFHRSLKYDNYEFAPGPNDQRVICGNRSDGYSEGTPSKACPTDLVSEPGVGHLAGDSPWNGEQLTRDEVFNQFAQDQQLETTVREQTFQTNSEISVPVTIRNTGETPQTVTVNFRVNSSTWRETTRTVPPGEQREVILTDTGLPRPGEVSIMRNGQKTGNVRIVE